MVGYLRGKKNAKKVKAYTGEKASQRELTVKQKHFIRSKKEEDTEQYQGQGEVM